VRNTPVTHSEQVTKRKPRWQSGLLTTAALTVAAEKFADKARKGGDTPYLSHLLAVSALVMEHGGSEEQAAAALLHDIIEDCNVSATELVALLVERGAARTAAEHVADMVKATTDGQASDKRDDSDWLQRKQAYINGLAKKSPKHPALLVSLADKVHNAEATLAQVRGGMSANDLYVSPEFNAMAADQKWYYTNLAAVFGKQLNSDIAAEPLVRRLATAVEEIFHDVADTGGPQ
jgi:Guanosine polyphosphate pyrophosphohydrolases/synthetases